MDESSTGAYYSFRMKREEKKKKKHDHIAAQGDHGDRPYVTIV